MDEAHKRGRQAPFGILEAASALAFAGLALLIGAAIGYCYLCPGQNPPAADTRVVPLTTYPGFQHNARFSPDGNQIAFSWFGGEDYNMNIYVKQIGAEKPLRLTADPATDVSPAWSPDGRYIAFRRWGSGKDGIYVVPAVGGLARKLLTLNYGPINDTSLDWSPDGKYLAYPNRGPDQSSAIFLLAVDNPKDKRPLTTFGQWDYLPRFSPDGQTVAFARSDDVKDIYLVRTAGGEPKRLTFGGASIYGLDWTPDGTHVIFFSGPEGVSVRPWKISVMGGQPEPLSIPPGIVEEPALSRDGRRLAYTREEFNANIWRYDVSPTDGQNPPPTRLIASTGENLDPQFSPDGRRISFLSSPSGDGEIWPRDWEVWVCDIDGSNPRQLTSVHVGAGAYPHWSPDSREIVFAASHENRSAIYVVSAEGGQPRRLTSDDSRVAAPSWSRDGKWIYFGSDRTGAWQVWKVPFVGGHAVQVTKKGGFAALESRDGKTLYYAKRIKFPGYRKTEGLWKVPVEGGEETLVLKELGAGRYECWGLTGEGIYFYNDRTKAIESSNFATHKIALIAKPEKQVRALAVSPDGRWILFSQVDLDTSHIMLVEDFRW